MGIFSNKLGIRLIVLGVVVVLIMIGFYFGSRWASQDRSVVVCAPDPPLVPLSRLGLSKKGDAVTSRAITDISTWASVELILGCYGGGPIEEL